MRNFTRSGSKKQEAVGHANHVRGATNLDSHLDFDRVPGRHFTYTAEGFEFRLRFGGFAWMITCATLGLEFPCQNQPPEDIAEVIRAALAEAIPDPDAWLLENLPLTTGPNYQYELEF